MKYETLELTRHNVTPSQFLAYVRTMIRRHNFQCLTTDWIDGEYFRRGDDWNFSYEDDPARPCRAEKAVSEPYRQQTYIKQWDGTVYNFILEWDEWDEGKGTGYFYYYHDLTDDESTDAAPTETAPTDKGAKLDAEIDPALDAIVSRIASKYPAHVVHFILSVPHLYSTIGTWSDGLQVLEVKTRDRMRDGSRPWCYIELVTETILMY